MVRVCETHLLIIAPAGYAASVEEMLQRWRADGNTVSELISPRFEPQTFRSRDERVTVRPFERLLIDVIFRYLKGKEQSCDSGIQTVKFSKNMRFALP